MLYSATKIVDGTNDIPNIIVLVQAVRILSIYYLMGLSQKDLCNIKLTL